MPDIKAAQALAAYIDKNYSGSILMADRYAISKPWWFEAWTMLGRKVY